MKKKLFIFVTIFALYLTACGKDEIVTDFSERVDALDRDIEVSDINEIADLYNVYNNMTDKQKEQVDNLDGLDTAYNKLDDHKNEEKYAVCIWLMNRLYSSLDSLDGFSVNLINYCSYETDEGYTNSMVYIDYNTNNYYGNSQHKKCLGIYMGDPDRSDAEGDNWYVYSEDNENYDTLYDIYNQMEHESINIDYILSYLDIVSK